MRTEISGRKTEDRQKEGRTTLPAGVGRRETH